MSPPPPLQCPLRPVAGTGKTSSTGPLALRVTSLAPSPSNCLFLKDTLSLPFLQTASLVVTQTSTTITQGCHLPQAEGRCSKSPQNPLPATGRCQYLLKGDEVYKLLFKKRIRNGHITIGPCCVGISPHPRPLARQAPRASHPYSP